MYNYNSIVLVTYNFPLYPLDFSSPINSLGVNLANSLLLLLLVLLSNFVFFILSFTHLLQVAIPFTANGDFLNSDKGNSCLHTLHTFVSILSNIYYDNYFRGCINLQK